MEKIRFFRQICIKAVCAVVLLVAAMYWLPLPHSVYPWIKFAALAGFGGILAFISSVHNNMTVSETLLFCCAFLCASAALQIAIWALCGEYVCYGCIDIMWITPLFMGILFFLCRDPEPFSDFIILKGLVIGSFLVVPLAILKFLGFIVRQI